MLGTLNQVGENTVLLGYLVCTPYKIRHCIVCMFCVCTYKYTYTTEYTIDQIWINYLETMTGRWINQSNDSQWRFKWEEKQERRKNERLAKSNGWVFRRSEVCGSLYAAGPKGEFALFPPPLSSSSSSSSLSITLTHYMYSTVRTPLRRILDEMLDDNTEYCT